MACVEIILITGIGLVTHPDVQSPELPVYGAKTLAVRSGQVELHGRAKSPPWARLAATANQGETRLQVAAEVDWQAGDEIVVASSSFLAEEVDRRTIVAVTLAGGVSTLELDRPLDFTHLGVVADFGGETVDMRAEVAVLTRNVVVQVRYSTKYKTVLYQINEYRQK